MSRIKVKGKPKKKRPATIRSTLACMTKCAHYFFFSHLQANFYRKQVIKEGRQTKRPSHDSIKGTTECSNILGAMRRYQ